MPLQNRVTPLGELIADPARGLVYGNRGCLHDDGRPHPAALQRQAVDRLPARVSGLAPSARCSSPAASRSSSSSTRRPRSLPVIGRARSVVARTTSVSARSARAPPGSERRRRDRRTAPPRAGRPARRGQLLHRAPLDELPEGHSCCALASHGSSSAPSVRWTPAGYADRKWRPRGEDAPLITPPSLVSILRADWQPAVPLLHPSAQRLALVAEPEARPGPEASHAVARVGELAAVEREAAAADALGETGLEAIELCYSLVDPGLPAPREARPVARPGARSRGSLASSTPISSSVSPHAGQRR